MSFFPYEPDPILMRQCELRSGNTTLITWLEPRLAVVGKLIQDDEGRVWIVHATYRDAMMRHCQQT